MNRVMETTTKIGELADLDPEFVALGVFQGGDLNGHALSFDEISNGKLKAFIDAGDFKGKLDETLLFRPEGNMPKRLLFVGLGKTEDYTNDVSRRAGAVAAKQALAVGITRPTICVMGEGYADIDFEEAAVATAEGAIMGSYKYVMHKTEAAKDVKLLEGLTVAALKAIDGFSEFVDRGVKVGHAVNWAKDIAVAPGNLGTPMMIAEWVKGLEKVSDKVKVTVLKRKEMDKLKMGALLAVAQGATLHEPTFMIVEYMGGPEGQKPIVIVGKGLVFDTGGISIKPSADMHKMTGDKGGGAAALGIMKAVITLDLPINVIGLVPSTFNMPDGAAYNPGDVITSMSGRTVEVQNTDAEGRMILIDALTYAERYEPKAVIDLATLTGSIMIALGEHAIGAFTNNQDLVDELVQAGEDVQERVWQMPLWKEYHKALKSETADVRNVGGRPAGSITAAAFLSKWAESYPWVHLDIAGVAWKTAAKPYEPGKICTGAGVRVVTELIRSRSRTT